MRFRKEELLNLHPKLPNLINLKGILSQTGTVILYCLVNAATQTLLKFSCV